METLTDRRRFMYAKKLPYDAELEYIESSPQPAKLIPNIKMEEGITIEMYYSYARETKGWWTYIVDIGSTTLRCGNRDNFILRVASDYYAVNKSYNYSSKFSGNIIVYAGGNSSSDWRCRLKYFKIYRNQKLIRHYIPVRVGLVPRYYDKITETFLTVSDCNLICGPDVIEGGE